MLRLPLLLVAALVGLLVAPAAVAEGVEDLPPVDTIVDRLLSGDLTPEELVEMGGHMSPEYQRDIKHSLPESMRERIAAVIHSRTTGAPEPQPEPREDEEYGGYDDEAEYSDPESDFSPTDEEPRGEPAQYKEPEVAAATEDGYSDLAEPAQRREPEPAEDYDGYELYEDPPAEPEPEPEPHGEHEAPEETAEQPMLRANAGVRDSGMLRADGGEGDSGMLSEGGNGGGGGSAMEGGVVPQPVAGQIITESTALSILRGYSRREAQVCRDLVNTLYSFYTEDQTRGPDKVRAELEYQKTWRQFAENTTQLDLSGLDRTDLVEVFMVLKRAGLAALDDQRLNDLNTAMTNLETTFARAEVCDYFDTKRCGLKLYKDIRVKLASSTDPDELSHFWLTWRGLLARNTRRQYTLYVEGLHAAAKLHNPSSDAWSLLMYPYTRGNSKDLLEQLQRVWEQEVSPLYWQLHTYARYRLRQRYGSLVPETGHIPAHLLGSLEADDWSALEPIMRPVDNASALDFHRNCIEKDLDVGSLKQKAASLYTDLGLNATHQDDILMSVLNVDGTRKDSALFLPRVLDRCYSPSSGNRHVAQAIYPTNTTLSDYIELIELFGAVQKYNERAQSPLADSTGFAYKDRDSFRDYGLDRAIGGARALAAISPAGLTTMLGFHLGDVTDNDLMNLQMAQALKLLPRLAASMAAVRWQAGVMTGEIPESQYNAKWWEYKAEYQGVSPPEGRDETQFDAFSDGTLTLPNHHIRRLIGGVAMFSIHKYHCRMYGGTSVKMSQCAILNSQQIGLNVRNVLVSGNSKPFKDQLNILTGSDTLSGAAMVEQLQPMSEWLVQFNSKTDPERQMGSNQTIAIIVGVVIAVIILGLVVFFVVARRKQKNQDYKNPRVSQPQQP